MRLAIPGSIVLTAFAMMLVACDSPTVISSANPAATRSRQAGDSGTRSMVHHQAGDVRQVVAVMHPTEGNSARGTVTFTHTDEGVRVVADITGLSPNGKHAIHVHEYGDARALDGTSAGGHYNPQGHRHDLPGNAPRHAGDLGNLTVTLDGDVNPIIGRGVIIHAGADDGGQPTGNAGPRISIGVIGVAQP